MAELYFIALMMVLILIVCAVVVYFFVRQYKREMKQKAERIAKGTRQESTGPTTDAENQ